MTGLLLMIPALPAGAEDFTALFQRAEAFHESVGEARARFEQSRQERRKVLAKLLPRLSLDASIGRRSSAVTTNFGPTRSVLRPKETRDLSLALGQTLYTGGRATTQLKIATLGRTLGALGLQSAREALLLALAQSYFEIKTHQENLASVSDRLAAMQRHLQAAQARVSLGADVRASALRLEAEVARLRSEKLTVEDALASARESLAALTGQGPDTTLGNGPDLSSIDALLGKDAADRAAQVALEQRVDLKVAAGETAAAGLAVKSTVGTFLPLVDLEGVYLTQSQDPSSSFSPEEDAFITLSLKWDLFKGGENVAERRRARSEFQEKRLQSRRLVREIRLEVRQAVRGVRVAQQRVASLDEASSYAAENHRIVTETYKAGAATYLDVIDASTTFGDARRDLANARFDYSLALLRLAQSTGQLLPLVGEQPAQDPRWAQMLSQVTER